MKIVNEVQLAFKNQFDDLITMSQVLYGDVEQLIDIIRISKDDMDYLRRCLVRAIFVYVEGVVIG